MRPPPFILVLKSNAPRRPETGLPGGVLPLELDALDDRDSRAMTVPDSHRPTHGPTPPKFPFQGQLPRFRSETGTQGAHGRDSGFLLSVRLVLEYAGCSRCKVGAGFCPQKAFGGRLRQAKCSACPTRGWVKSAFHDRPPKDAGGAGSCPSPARGTQGLHRGTRAV